MTLQRKSPMKRGGQLKRSPMKRTGKIKPKPKPAPSIDELRERAEYDDQKRRIEARSGGVCEVRADERCTRRATDPHHVWRRGASLRDPGPLVAPLDVDLLHVCRQCHVGFIHGDETRARELGLIARSLDELIAGRNSRPHGVPGWNHSEPVE